MKREAAVRMDGGLFVCHANSRSARHAGAGTSGQHQRGTLRESTLAPCPTARKKTERPAALAQTLCNPALELLVLAGLHHALKSSSPEASASRASSDERS